MTTLLGKYNRCVCGMERGQALLFGRIKADFMENGEYLPWFLKYLEDLREMVKGTFHMERTAEIKEWKGRVEGKERKCEAD